MYTEEPNDFETKSVRELNDKFAQFIDDQYSEYDKLDWQWLNAQEKKQQLYNNIKSVLNRYHYRFDEITGGFRIYFESNRQFLAFKTLRNHSKVLQLIEPDVNEFRINPSGFMDYKIKKC